jgi:pyruvate dehydrogenase E1 component alpha subunit
MSFHNTTDNPSRYQDPKDYEEAKTRDPIERVQKYLATIGLWDGKKEEAWSEELREENDRALKLAAAAQPPVPDDVFANVYQDPPPRVARQRSELAGGQRD